MLDMGRAVTTAVGGAGFPGVMTAAGGTGIAGAVARDGSGGSGASSVAGLRSWPTVECVGGPCAAPNVCVNLDFLFVACVPCGGNDQVCCPPNAAGTCDAGLSCAPNPNFQDNPRL